MKLSYKNHHLGSLLKTTCEAHGINNRMLAALLHMTERNCQLMMHKKKIALGHLQRLGEHTGEDLLLLVAEETRLRLQRMEARLAELEAQHLAFREPSHPGDGPEGQPGTRKEDAAPEC